MTVVFIHGVPDTSALWKPVIGALGLKKSDYFAPNLPGFGSSWPEHFIPTKDGYADWLLKQIEDVVAKAGRPADIVGHDWGAIFTLRIASLRPDLVRSWTVIDAVLHPSYDWHKTAKRWQTPILGELLMAVSTPRALKKALRNAGVPEDTAETEMKHWNGLMKRSILSLYRSARTVSDEWVVGLQNLPKNGLVIFGEDDPFVGADIARAFAEDQGVPVHIEGGKGHWILLEDPQLVARLLSERIAEKDSLPP
ncbi:MAG: alpha/beta hydrolase [Pseudomonadota bacterium]